MPASPYWVIIGVPALPPPGYTCRITKLLCVQPPMSTARALVSWWLNSSFHLGMRGTRAGLPWTRKKACWGRFWTRGSRFITRKCGCWLLWVSSCWVCILVRKVCCSQSLFSVYMFWVWAWRGRRSRKDWKTWWGIFPIFFWSTYLPSHCSANWTVLWL